MTTTDKADKQFASCVENRIDAMIDTDNQKATDTPEYPTMIDVIVEGGVIQEIIGIPEGVTVRVIDYDTDGTPEDELSISPYSGETCIIGEW